VFTRDEIAERCYPDAEGGVSDQAIDGVVRRLRARLAEVDPDARHVEAVRGHGFRLRE
jgi:DNA-binding response OmpR family regulator